MGPVFAKFNMALRGYTLKEVCIMTLLREEKFLVAYLAFLAVLMVLSIFFVEGS